jgi:hypothetical protein
MRRNKKEPYVPSKSGDYDRLAMAPSTLKLREPRYIQSTSDDRKRLALNPLQLRFLTESRREYDAKVKNAAASEARLRRMREEAYQRGLRTRGDARDTGSDDDEDEDEDEESEEEAEWSGEEEEVDDSSDEEESDSD